MKSKSEKISAEYSKAIKENKNIVSATGGAKFAGYSVHELESLPEGITDNSFGCGNPLATSSVKEGDVVLDLGCGTGLDLLLAAEKVGAEGKVVGIDMNEDMLKKAKENIDVSEFKNIELRKGRIEDLPVESGSIDWVISNCVINLSPDKQQVFSEAFRVLKPGGRLAISDVVASTELPDTIKNDLALYSGCMAGASLIGELQNILENCGYEQIKIAPKDDSTEFIKDWAPGRGVEDYVLSATIEAIKPGGCCDTDCCN